MNKVRSVYRLYKKNSLEQRKTTKIILFMLAVAITVNTNVIVSQHMIGFPNYNYYISLCGLIAVFMMELKWKFIDLKYREESYGAISSLMKYTPLQERSIYRLCNIKLLIGSLLCIMGIWFINILIMIVKFWDNNTDFTRLIVIEVMVILFMTVVLSIPSKRTQGIPCGLLVGGILLLMVGVVNLPIPITCQIDKTITGLWFQSDRIYRFPEEIELQPATVRIKGEYKRYLFEDGNIFTGIICSEEFEFNQKEKQLEVVFYDNQGYVSYITFNNETYVIESLGNVYCQEEFDNVCIELIRTITGEKSGYDYTETIGFFYEGASSYEDIVAGRKQYRN